MLRVRQRPTLSMRYRAALNRDRYDPLAKLNPRLSGVTPDRRGFRVRRQGLEPRTR